MKSLQVINYCVVGTIAFCIGAIAFVPIPLHSAEAPKKITWEYKEVNAQAIERDPERFFQQAEYSLRQLNKLGEDGWELASVTTVQDAPGTYIFKRQK
jgi:hypothetical protein